MLSLCSVISISFCRLFFRLILGIIQEHFEGCLYHECLQSWTWITITELQLVLKKAFEMSKDFCKESFSKTILHLVFLQAEELYAWNLWKSLESRLLPWNNSKIWIRWQSKIRFQWCSGTFQRVQETNKVKISIRYNFWF